MNDEKLEDLKISSTVIFIISLIGTIMFVAGEIDAIKYGKASMIWLIIIALIFTIGSLIVLIIPEKAPERCLLEQWHVFSSIIGTLFSIYSKFKFS